jgi:CRP-like cAMP-binding protein
VEAAKIVSLPLFAELSPDEQERVASAARPMHYQPGEEIVHEGELSFDFYAITAGAAEVRRGNEHIADLRAGDVLGEMGVLPRYSRLLNRRRGATVIVTAPTDAIAIDGRVFRQMTEEMPALAAAVHTLAEQRRASEQ